MTTELTIVIPCFNELPHLHSSIRRIRDFVNSLNFGVEIIFVDDGSTDGTRDVLEANQGPLLSSIFHESNQGRGAAVTSGILAASSPFVGYCDIDMEVDIFQMVNLVAAIRQRGHVVIGKRQYKFKLRSMHRQVMSVGYRHISSLYLGTPRRDTETGFKVFRRLEILPVLDSIRSLGWFWDTEVVVRAHVAGLEILEVPVSFVRRSDKRSSVRIWNDTFRYLVELRRFRAEMRDARAD